MNNKKNITITTYMKNLKEQAHKIKSGYKNIYVSKDFQYVKNNLTIFQKKLVFYAISQLTHQDRDLTAYKLAQQKIYIHVNEFFEIMGINKKGGHYYDLLKKEVENLGRVPLEVINENITQKIYWLDSITYNNKDFVKENSDFNNSIIAIRFTQSISEFLTQFSKYIKYNFLISHSLKNKHAIRIYELLQTRKDTNKVILPLDKFSYCMDLAKSYSVKSQMKKYVLERAKNELNEKFNLGFNYEFLGDNIILTAKINDDDLVKTIFNTNQIQLLTEEDKEFFKSIKEQEKREKSTNFIPY